MFSWKHYTNLTAWRDRGVIQNSSSKKKPKFPRKDEFRHRVATKLIKKQIFDQHLPDQRGVNQHTVSG